MRKSLLLGSTILLPLIGGLAQAQSPATSAPRGLSIAIDGKQVAGSKALHTLSQRSSNKTDSLDVDVRFDGFEYDRYLNVSAVRTANGALFAPYWNYSHWIKKAEVRVFATGESTTRTPLAVLPVDLDKGTVALDLDTVAARASARSLVPIGRESNDVQVQYVLRVYDDRGRFDETASSVLDLGPLEGETPDEEKIRSELLSGYGKDNLAIENISVGGGAVTIQGRGVPEGESIYVAGKLVPTDVDGDFAIREILPVGEHEVTVAMKESGQIGVRTFYRRSDQLRYRVYLPRHDTFYTALADVTVGQNNYSGDETAKPDDDGDVYTRGRLAFYLKSRLEGEYIITAMADTEEKDLKDIFDGFGETGPQGFLKHIDPDRYFSEFGDDSTIHSDAPTRGKFYFRVERGDDHITWGTGKIALNDNSLSRLNRTVYGATGQLTLGQTRFGEDSTTVVAGAWQPDERQTEDVFLATGGSWYNLAKDAIVPGSESVRLETRDEQTGRIIDSQTLVYGKDFEIDYLQGRVLLTKPISADSPDGFLVQNGGLQNPKYLVVDYTHNTSIKSSRYDIAGRAHQWIGDYVGVGIQGLKEGDDGDRRKVLSGDITLRYTPNTYIKTEYSYSEGLAQKGNSSIDGGFNFDGQDRGSNDKSGRALRVEAQVDLEDVVQSDVTGVLGAYYQRVDEDYRGGDSSAIYDRLSFGASADLTITDSLRTKLAYDHYEKISGSDKHDLLRGDLTYKFENGIYVQTGFAYEKNDEGHRTDLAGRVGYSAEDWDVYTFYQNTVSSSRGVGDNQRYGIGGNYKFSDKWSVGGEVSDGDTGLRARVRTEWSPSTDQSYYLGYDLTRASQSDSFGLKDTQGSFVMGARHRYNNKWSGWGEEKIGVLGGKAANFVHAYGLDFKPAEKWNLAFSYEHTENIDNDISDTGYDLTRDAVTLGVSYTDAKTKAGVSLEAILDDYSGGTNSDRDTLLARAYYKTKLSDDWRLNTKLNIGFSNDDGGSFFDGRFVEAVVGFAWRPAHDDRWNVLAQYSYLYDKPSTRTGLGSSIEDGKTFEGFADYKQESHILNVDATFQASKKWTLGAKYGLKYGKNTTSRDSDDWTKSTIQLGILRADWHLVNKWDIFAEARVMDFKETDQTKAGALLGVYRHFGNNFKVGVGYNFSGFNDDLSNVSLDQHGWFFNVVGKF